jgi:hypothetical protein
MQLVAYGAQDVYLTGNPKVTFFQAIYKRHTNFAMEVIPQTINGTAGSNQRISVTIARNGDLVGYMYAQLTPTNALYLTSNNNVADTCWIAERAFSAIELTIGGQRIDKHFQSWWRVYSELNLSDENKVQYNKMTTLSNPQVNNAGAVSQGIVYLPFIFFFNRNPGLYLPLIALQYHEVRLDIDCAPNYATYFGTAQPTIWANYVFLDTEERRRFAQKGHEYLIEQVQHTGGDTIPSGVTETNSATIRLSFNHPVKELCWVYQNSSFPSASLNALWNFTSNVANVNVTVSSAVLANTNSAVRTTELGSPQILMANVIAVSNLNLFTANFIGATPIQIGHPGALNGWTEEGAPASSFQQQGGLEVGPLHQFKLILNGQDRFKEQFGKFFNQLQPFYHHSGNPYPGVYSYSFALHPEEHQPTGTCNFSRIDNAQVQVWLKNRTEASSSYIQKLFAVNYNILRIQSGMGGLAFSN